MVNAFIATATLLAAVATTAAAAAMPTGAWPASTGNVKYSEPYVVKAGTTFDGGMKTYERSNVQCTEQHEDGPATAVFHVEAGATLKNVIIGKNQAEGVHCEQSGCTIQNVWWDDVCEDALSIKGGSASSVSKVIGGGARFADDKVIQHNGPGLVSIDSFYVQDFGKLYRSCGNCKSQVQRKVTVANVYAVNPKVGIVTVNKNLGDEAKLSNIKIKTSRDVEKVEVCAWSQAVTSGEPKKLGHGPSPPLCQCKVPLSTNPTAQQAADICSKCSKFLDAAKKKTFPTCTFKIDGVDTPLNIFFDKIVGACVIGGGSC